MTISKQPRLNYLLTPRWPLGALLPIILGCYCIVLATTAASFSSLFLLPSGLLMTATGVATLLWPGQLKSTQYLALGAFLGLPAAIAAMWVAGFFAGLVVLCLSLTSWFYAGAIGRWQLPALPDVDEPARGLALASHMAADDALLGYFTLIADIPTRDRAARVAAETLDMAALHEDKGWSSDPASYHRAPPELHLARISEARCLGHTYEQVSFDSEFEPYVGEPGRDRWLDHKNNRTGHAWMLRHKGEDRPWLLAVHGYRMGFPVMDMSLFSPRWFHERLGLNVLMPVLPLHGPRRVGLHSGNQFVDGHLSDFVLAEAQAMWDIRRLLGWLRQSEGAESIGALGISLGGYNVSLLSTLESNLNGVIAGVPLTDLADVVWHHVPEGFRQGMAGQGLDLATLQRAYQSVSPFASKPLINKENLSIFAGVADRFLPAQQAVNLAEHWGGVVPHWYQGSHLSFLFEQDVRGYIDQRLGDMGLIVTDQAKKRAA